MSFGETLRAAREAKGLTCSEVAKRTRLLVQIVEEMENEDFHRIAAPIYGRGFVRLYAQCVGLDPTPLVREFMDIYEGHRAPIVRTRSVPTTEQAPEPVVPAPAPVFSEEPAMPAIPPPPPPMPTFSAMPPSEPVNSEPVVEPEPVTPAPAPVDTASIFVSDSDPLVPPVPEPVPESPVASEPEPEPEPEPTATPEPEPLPASEPPPALRGLDLFEQAYSNQQSAGANPPPRDLKKLDESPFLPPSYEDETGPTAGERFKAGLSNVSHGILSTVRRIPRSTWRFSLLGIAALVVIALIAFSCVKLYQITTPPAENPLQQVAEKKPAVPATAQPSTAAAKTPAAKVPGAGSKKPTTQSPAKAMAAGGLRSTGEKIPSLYVD